MIITLNDSLKSCDPKLLCEKPAVIDFNEPYGEVSGEILKEKFSK